MNVLIISPFFPSPEDNGSKMRLNGLIRSLVGHRIFLIAFSDPKGVLPERIDASGVFRAIVHPIPKMTVLRKIFNHFSFKPLLAKRFYSREVHREVTRIIADEKIDVVVCESLLTAEYARRVHCPHLVLDEHNLEFIRASGRIKLAKHWPRKLYVGLIMLRLRRYELSMARKFDWILTCSEQDRRTLTTHLSKERIVVFENSLDVTEYSWSSGQADPRNLVFVGTMWYEPNVDAALFFAKEIFPLIQESVADARLVIAGSGPEPCVAALNSIRGVVVKGYQRDIRPLLREAGIMVVPLRMGSGTRLKILVAMSLGIPVVSTSIGCEGLDVKDGEHLMVADTPGQFTDKIFRLISDPEYRTRISMQARKKIEAKYDRRVAAGKLAEFWQELDSGEANACRK